MHPGSRINQVYLCAQPIDFRKSIDGLCGIVEQELEHNVFGDALYVFVNRQRTKIKALYWHRNGFCLWYKRLEAERFAWPRVSAKLSAGVSRAEHIHTVSMQQLEWLLEGFDIWNKPAHKTLHFASVS